MKPLVSLKTGAALILVALLVICGSGQAQLVCPNYHMYQITNDGLDDLNPRVSGWNVVWEEHYPNGNRDIFLFDGATTTQLSNSAYTTPFGAMGPRIAGSNAAWAQDDGTTWQIFRHDVGTATTTQITTSPDADRLCDVSAGHIIWQSQPPMTTLDLIRLYDVATGTNIQAPSPNNVNSEPKVDGSFAVWLDWGPTDSEVILYSINAGTYVQLTSNTLSEFDPQISTSYVVWGVSDGNDDEIWLHDMSYATTTQITNNFYTDSEPRVSGSVLGSYIVWEGHPGAGDSEIFLYDIIARTTTQITNNSLPDNDPEISGTTVTWHRWTGTDHEIFIYDTLTTATTQLTNDLFDDGEPDVSGLTVVWPRNDGNDHEIVMATKPICNPLPVGDFNRDCWVNKFDFAYLAQYWRQSWPNPWVMPVPSPDLDGDLDVDWADLAILRANWLVCNIQPPAFQYCGCIF